MKRDTFVRLTATAVAGLCISNFHCRSRVNSQAGILARPEALERICDGQTIRTIGQAYLKQSREDEEALVKILSSNRGRTIILSSDDSTSVVSLLNQQTQDDFTQNRTVVADGWILSITEARQCALWALSEK